MTLADVGDIYEYWEIAPPTHLMVQVIARMLGWKPSQAESPRSSLGEVVAQAAKLGMAVERGGDLGMPAPVLDLDEFREKNRARALAIARRNMIEQHG